MSPWMSFSLGFPHQSVFPEGTSWGLVLPLCEAEAFLLGPGWYGDTSQQQAAGGPALSLPPAVPGDRSYWAFPSSAPAAVLIVPEP